MTKLAITDYLTPVFAQLIPLSIVCNTADSIGPTDAAMVELMERFDVNFESLKSKHLKKGAYTRFPFTSKRKRMSTIVGDVGKTQYNYEKRVLLKGASEIVKKNCTHYLNASGEVSVLTDEVNEMLNEVISSYAQKALRTIAVAYKDLQPGEGGPSHMEEGEGGVMKVEEGGYTLVCIFGIQDIVRKEVPDAIKQVGIAGVMVRMVTGDNLITAMAIAKDCGIISEKQIGDKEVCMIGPEFYDIVGGLSCANCSLKIPFDCQCDKKDQKEVVTNAAAFKAIKDKLRVLARSRPEDKYLLVTGLRQFSAVVAVTGDGTNDAPALKKADVGFAMGMTGTDVCKDAADILLTDDNFASIVKAAKWGRNVYDNIQRFLQFQLTVNVVALITAFIGSCILTESPLTALQLLWVNLIMDSLASLALATEKPVDALLARKPQSRQDYIVSRKMIKHILGMSICQAFIIFFLVFYGENIIPESCEDKYQLDRDYPVDGPCFVYPGRPYYANGIDPLYKKFEEEYGPSRHLTFIFTLFVFFQIFNMLVCRKIHDELNWLSGIFTNFIFIGVWLVICIGQVVITQFTGYVFSVHLDGLNGAQWGMAIGIGATSIIFDFILKFIPDRWCPQIGNDSFYDDRESKRRAALNQ